MGEKQKPTEAQKHWLYRVLGPQVWADLCRKAEFIKALETSNAQARRIAIHYLAAQERVRRLEGITD